MIFFMIMPSLFGAFGNFLLPTQLGVHDVAFPRLNSAAFWFLPGGLIMLFQLVCIDRRYQKMNCFNMRELQGLLKRRFFTDLINSSDHRELLNHTMINLRYKTNGTQSIDQSINLFYSYGINLSNLNKFNSLGLGGCVFNNLRSTPVLLKLLRYLEHTLGLGSRQLLGLSYYLDDILIEGGTSVVSDLIFCDAPIKMFIGEDYTIVDVEEECYPHPGWEMYFNFLLDIFDNVIWRFNLTPLITLQNILYVYTDTMAVNAPSTNLSWEVACSYLNYYSSGSVGYIYWRPGGSPQRLFFTSTSSPTLDNSGLRAEGNELVSSPRFLRFNNPLVDVISSKYGDYTPNWDKLYPSLITTLLEIPEGKRRNIWFRFNDHEDVYEKSFIEALDIFSDEYATLYRLGAKDKKHALIHVEILQKPVEDMENEYTDN